MVKNKIIKYDTIKTTITLEENKDILKLINQVSMIIRDVRESGVRHLTFKDIDDLEDFSDKVEELMKFKKQKHESSEHPMWWADKVLPTDKNAWYQKEEDDE
tara:strand:- start:196 stop:501 length:306 start_codon:yes stop_codon:yes gene_type:complete